MIVLIFSYTNDLKTQKSYLLLLLASNGNLLTLQGPAIVLSTLSSARKPLNVPYASVTLDILQSLYISRVEPSLKPANTLNQTVTKRLNKTKQKLRKCEEQTSTSTNQVSFNHVFGNFIPESDELLLRKLLGDFVIHVEVTEDLPRSDPPNSMNILQ